MVTKVHVVTKALIAFYVDLLIFCYTLGCQYSLRLGVVCGNRTYKKEKHSIRRWLSGLFSQKIIWLRPSEDLFQVTQHLITGMLPVSRICTAYYYHNEGIYAELWTLGQRIFPSVLRQDLLRFFKKI